MQGVPQISPLLSKNPASSNWWDQTERDLRQPTGGLKHLLSSSHGSCNRGRNTTSLLPPTTARLSPPGLALRGFGISDKGVRSR